MRSATTTISPSMAGPAPITSCWGAATPSGSATAMETPPRRRRTRSRTQTRSQAPTTIITQDGYSGGSYVGCADRAEPGVGSILDYLAALPYRPNSNCEPGHFYLVNNYNPGYLGDGTVDKNDPFTVPPAQPAHHRRRPHEEGRVVPLLRRGLERLSSGPVQLPLLQHLQFPAIHADDHGRRGHAHRAHQGSGRSL